MGAKSYHLLIQNVKRRFWILNKRNVLVAFAAFTFSLIVFWQPILGIYGEWLSTPELGDNGDIVISLGGSHRLDAAANFLDKRGATAIYADEGKLNSGTYTKLMEIATQHGVAKDAVFWGGVTKNTFDEALTFKDTLRLSNYSYTDLIIVSDIYHLRRAKWAFQKVLGPHVKIRTYPSQPDNFTLKKEWWKDGQNRMWVISETKKFAFYLIYYGLLNQKHPLSPRDLPFL